MIDENTQYQQAEAVDTIMQDLSALRKLASQLKRMAPTMDDQVLRAILGKREALLNSIHANLIRNDPDGAAAGQERMNAEHRRMFVETVSEIAKLDHDAADVLKTRAEEIASEIHKLRAGKHWRESSVTWK